MKTRFFFFFFLVLICLIFFFLKKFLVEKQFHLNNHPLKHYCEIAILSKMDAENANNLQFPTELDDQSKAELRQFMENEAGKAKIKECMYSNSVFCFLVYISVIIHLLTYNLFQQFYNSQIRKKSKQFCGQGLFWYVFEKGNANKRCFKQCMNGPFGNSLSKSDEGCIENCVNRFLDTNVFFVQR